MSSPTRRAAKPSRSDRLDNHETRSYPNTAAWSGASRAELHGNGAWRGGATDPASLVAGYNAAFMTAAALAAAALVLAVVVLQRRPAREETAVEAEPAVLVG